MKKKAMAAVLMMSLAAGSSLTVCAAPETKADGTVFDAEYYAQMYPDVVAALGTDAGALYNHYVTFGRNEGRLPYEPGTVQTAEVPAPAIKTGTTPAEVLVLMESSFVQYPEFMLTDSRPIKSNQWAVLGNRLGSRPAYVSTYEYDNEGRLIRMRDNGSKPVYTYDVQGKMIHCDANVGIKVSADLEYDAQGRIKQYKSSGTIYNFKYNNSGLLISMGDDKFGYDTQNKLVWRTSAGNGFQTRWDYNYDELGRLIKKTKNVIDEDGGQGYVMEYIYNYDEQGRMINRTEYYDAKPRELEEFIYE